jgi:hypothetical protein
VLRQVAFVSLVDGHCCLFDHGCAALRCSVMSMAMTLSGGGGLRMANSD